MTNARLRPNTPNVLFRENGRVVLTVHSGEPTKTGSRRLSKDFGIIFPANALSRDSYWTNPMSTTGDRRFSGISTATAKN